MERKPQRDREQLIVCITAVARAIAAVCELIILLHGM